MTTTTSSAPKFTVRSSSSGLRALFIAALCAFIVTTFLVDLNQGAAPSANTQVEQRT
jgi:hypothetical protein